MMEASTASRIGARSHRVRSSVSGGLRISSLLVAPSSPYKIVLAGIAGVGKSSLVHRIRAGEFIDKPPGHVSSVRSPGSCRADWYTLTRNVEGDTLKVDIFDTAGLERYNSLTPNYYANAKAVLLVFALDNSTSLHALNSFREEAISGSISVDEDCYFALVGNKLDLEADLEQSHLEYAVEGLRCDGLFLTSAKTGEGVDYLLHKVIKEMHQRARVNKDTSQPEFTTQIVASTTRTNKCCKS